MPSIGGVREGAAAEAVDRHVPDLADASFASKLFAQDPTLWGPDAESEATVRLSWVGLPWSSRPLVDEIAAIRDDLSDRTASTTSSSAAWVARRSRPRSSARPPGRAHRRWTPATPTRCAPRSRTARADGRGRLVEVRLHAGDRLAAACVRGRLQGRPTSTRASGSSSSPTPAARSTRTARTDGYRVVNADPDVGGRYSALTAFGLVPSGLAGVDIGELLDEAELVTDVLAADDESNPALRLGAAMAGTSPLRDKLVLARRRHPGCAGSRPGPSS